MKKLFLSLLIGAALTSCATFTLVTVNLDAEGLLSPSLRSNQISAPATGGSTRLPNDTGGDITNLPQLSFLEKARVKLALTFTPVAGNASDLNLTIDLFLGPSSASDVFQTQYRLSSTTVVVTPTTGSQAALDIALDPASTDANARNALSEIKKGSFKYGLRIVSAASAGGKIDYTINNLDFSVTGYPVKIIKP